MRANFNLNKITENWGVKVLCFVVALFLYLFYQMELVEKQTVVVPITLEQNGGVELKEAIQPSVKVFIRTKTSTTVHPDDFKAIVNLDYLSKTGVYDIPVSLIVSDDLMAIDPMEIKIKPETVKVNVERRISGSAFVFPETTGEVNHGYRVAGISVDPEIVQITGPESIVQTENAFKTEVISLNGLSADRNFLVRLQKPNKKLYYEDAQSYLVTVKVDPIIEEKTVTGIEPVFKNLPENFEIESLSQPVTASFRGPVLRLERMNSSSLAFSIDLSSVSEDGEMEFPVSLKLSSDVELENISDTVWKVKVTKKEIVIPEETEPSENLQEETSVSETNGNGSL